MTVISAGTLCGGASYRFGRAYNVVELDTKSRTGLLHLREMQNDNLQLPIWGRRALPPRTSSYLDFEFDAPPAPEVHADVRTRTLMEGQRRHNNKEYGKAAEILASIAQSDELARRLLLDCFVQLNDMPAIISNFDPPKSAVETVHLLDALWVVGKHDRLRLLLGEPIVANSNDPSVAELRKKYTRRLAK